MDKNRSGSGSPDGGFPGETGGMYLPPAETLGKVLPEERAEELRQRHLGAAPSLPVDGMVRLSRNAMLTVFAVAGVCVLAVGVGIGKSQKQAPTPPELLVEAQDPEVTRIWQCLQARFDQVAGCSDDGVDWMEENCDMRWLGSMRDESDVRDARIAVSDRAGVSDVHRWRVHERSESISCTHKVEVGGLTEQERGKLRFRQTR